MSKIQDIHQQAFHTYVTSFDNSPCCRTGTLHKVDRAYTQLHKIVLISVVRSPGHVRDNLQASLQSQGLGKLKQTYVASRERDDICQI